MIMKAGVDTGIPALKDLLDMNLPEPFIHQIRTIFNHEKEHHAELQHLHSVRGRKMGHYYILDLQIQLDPHTSVANATRSIDALKSEIMKDMKDVHEGNASLAI